MRIFMTIMCMCVAISFGADIEIKDAFVKFVPHNTKASAGFMEIYNNTNKDIALISAQSDIAKSTELHQHIHQNGVATMVQIPQIPIQAKSSTALQSGSYHIMFIDLIKPLKKGQKISLTLTFSDNTTLLLNDIEVKEALEHHHSHH